MEGLLASIVEIGIVIILASVLLFIVEVFMVVFNLVIDLILEAKEYFRDKRLTRKYGPQNPNAAPREWRENINNKRFN